MTDTVATSQPWYRGLSRHQWNILLAANLGWLFDGFELYALFLTVGPAMRALLEPSQYPQIPAYIGTVVAITLLGWGFGGIGSGVFVASFVWLYVSMLGPDSWRYLFLIGILPAVLTLWIRTSIPESNKWEQINERRKAARERQRSGTVLAAEEH